MAAFVKRLRKELQGLERSPDPDIELYPEEDNIRIWKAFIRGPADTPFEGGRFELRIEVGQEYPIRPPLMRFVTRVFHPNIHFETGEICLDILKKEWSPAWSLQAACRAVTALLSAPDADSPLNCDAGNMVRAGDLQAYQSVARMYTVEYAGAAAAAAAAASVGGGAGGGAAAAAAGAAGAAGAREGR